MADSKVGVTPGGKRVTLVDTKGAGRSTVSYATRSAPGRGRPLKGQNGRRVSK